jgi:general secretion pathway protein D
VKRTAALLVLIGLVSMHGASAQEKAPVSPEASSSQIDVKKIRSHDDYVTLNFTNVDINALVKVMSELTRRNFILDERVTGKVTLMTPTKISPDEAYQVFLSALEIKGFTAVEDGKIIRIIPAASARQSGLKVYQDGDIKGEGFVTKLVRLNFVNPQEIVRTITPLVSKDGNLIAYQATNSIIITDSVYNIRKIESLIHAMDVAAPEGKGKINVYYLKYANAEDIAKLMQALVSRMPVPLAGGAPQPAGPATILEGAVSISSDKATNSLIIVGSPGDFETMKDVIQKLDIRRRQVYVEAAIIEMSLTKMRDVGFEFLYVPQEIQAGPGAPTTPIGGTNFGNIAKVATGPAAFSQMSGLAVGVIKGTFTYNSTTYLNVGALVHALQNDGNVNVLSTPNILTLDNQKAEIMVGQNVPFLTGQTQNATTGSGTLFNTIERKDVGITLKITPQITSDDSVRLEVYQEISDVIVQASLLSSSGPVISKRSASTTVVVKDRQTMVIGGLIRDNVTSSTSKVPWLGDIPLLGWLFKSKTTNVDKANLMIFITPYIIKSEGDAADITKRKGDAIEKFRDENLIEKKDVGGLVESKRPAPEDKGPGQVRTDEGNSSVKPADLTPGTTAPAAPVRPEDQKGEPPAPEPKTGASVSAPQKNGSSQDGSLPPVEM